MEVEPAGASSDRERAQGHVRLHEIDGATAVAAAVGTLRERGERLTAPRRAVVEVLAEDPDHLSAQAIADRVHERGVHRATVYRTLDLLVHCGVVARRSESAGGFSYHLAAPSSRHGHQHGHCMRCGEVIAIPVEAVADLTAEVERRTGFVLDAHRSSFEGLCARCR